MAAIFWSNVGVDVQTALGSPITLASITKANPGVAGSVAHGLSDGDFVYLEIVGMYELNTRVARVANKANDTFQLEGFNTTGYSTFVSGTAKKITFGASMSTAQGVNVSGGEPEFADTTTIHDNVRKRSPTVVSPMSMQIESFYDPADAALVELAAATDAKTQRAIKLRFAGGSLMVGAAYCSAALVPTGTAQDIVKTPVSLEFQGLPKVYAS